MPTYTRTQVATLLIIIAAIAFVLLRQKSDHTTETSITKASYVCDDAKTISASYDEGTSKLVPSTTTPPIPTGSVELMLSDGRTMILPQTISADGTRYANKDDSVIFWSKGNGLVFTENGKETYTGCIQIAPDSESLPHVYINTTQKFSIRYPLGYSVKDATEDWFGVGFFIATSTTVGTNLSTDTHMSVEEINTKSGSTEECTAGRFLGRELQTISTTTENGVTYSVGTASGAGAGNRYEETIYALIGTNPCFAVRYFIHYSAIENYSEGSVKAFDMQALFTEFDAIRHTLIIGQ